MFGLKPHRCFTYSISRRSRGRFCSCYPNHYLQRFEGFGLTLETIGPWYKLQGEKVEVGDALVQFEFETAFVDCVAESDGFLARMFLDENTDINTISEGSAIALIVYDEKDIKNFENYTPHNEDHFW
eukprot:UN27339